MIWRLMVTLAIGAVAGFAAGEIMRFRAGLALNIALGVAGSMVGGLLCHIIGIYTSGWVASTLVSIAGACLVVFLVRKFAAR